jgi:hypothetical protein
VGIDLACLAERMTLDAWTQCAWVEVKRRTAATSAASTGSPTSITLGTALTSRPEGSKTNIGKILRRAWRDAA